MAVVVRKSQQNPPAGRVGLLIRGVHVNRLQPAISGMKIRMELSILGDDTFPLCSGAVSVSRVENRD